MGPTEEVIVVVLTIQLSGDFFQMLACILVRQIFHFKYIQFMIVNIMISDKLVNKSFHR